MQKATLIKLFNRDLNTLKAEINAYKDEKNLWKLKGLVTNSAGNLCLHLVGNLNHYIGTSIGNTGYIRERDLEFTKKDVPRAELIQQIDATALMIESVVSQLSNKDLAEAYTNYKPNEPITTEYFLSHLAMHLAYHLGQINYHRRLLD